MIKPMVTILAIACIGLNGGCAAPQAEVKADKYDKVIGTISNKAPNATRAIISVAEAESTVEYLCRKPDIGVNVFHEQKYDLEIEGIKYYYFDILYGLTMAKSPELGGDILTRVFVSSKDKSIYLAVEGNDDKWDIGGRIGKELQTGDFEFIYNDLAIKPGMEAKGIIDKLGSGSADEDNNYGFIGWSDDNKYKYYRHEYESFSIYTKVNVIDGTSIVSQIDLKDIPAKRGIRKGNTYRELLRIYGAPAYDEVREGKIYSVYKYQDLTLTFVINEDKIIDGITMAYENRIKENNYNNADPGKESEEINSINKCMDIAAGMVGIKDWKTLNATDFQDGENLYISFDGKNNDGRYVIGVRRTRDTAVNWWYHFDPITFDYEVIQ